MVAVLSFAAQAYRPSIEHRGDAPSVSRCFRSPASSVAVLAIAFHATTGKDASEVLFSGQSALPGLVTGAGAWSVGALLALLAFKSVAWGISLGSFRGGPTFPAMFIGAAAGLVGSHLPGFSMTGAVGVGIGTGVVSMLRLPLSAVVLATVLVSDSGAGTGPLIIVGVVVAYVASVGLDRALARRQQSSASTTSAVAPAEAAGHA